MKNSELKDNIFKLRNEGKTYAEIKKELNCSLSIISYYLDPNGKEKVKIKSLKNNLNACLKRKKDNFQCIGGWRTYDKNGKGTAKSREPSLFTAKELKEKLQTHPFCYITGEKIDLLQPKTYQLDHIHPISRGGDNSLNNCGLTTRIANISKSNMTLSEFLNLCHTVLEHHGYKIYPPKSAERRSLEDQP